MASRDKIKVGSINVHCLFKNMIVVAFQIIFHVKMHQNNIFLFLKNYF
jgi:hypothetical protein